MSRDMGPRLFIVAQGPDGPVDVLTSAGDGPWRTFNAAVAMKREIEAQSPHGPNVTYHIVNGHRA